MARQRRGLREQRVVELADTAPRRQAKCDAERLPPRPARAQDGGAASENWSALGVAFVVSAITAFVAVKWLLGYIQTHRFTVFAWYRIVLGVALLAAIGAGVLPN